MQTDKFGIPVYSESDIIDIIFNNINDVDQIIVDIPQHELDQFNKSIDNSLLKPYTELQLSVQEFDQSLQSDWLMPEEYKEMDIEGFLVDQCPKENYQRLIDELQEFRTRNMLDLLRWMKYFVDTCRKNKVVWGVGRGSSVASYVLYLIGVHKIDSLKYNLDWREFLR
jgi:DNA polymerase III alpha subunit